MSLLGETREMASSPPASPAASPSRPLSAFIRPPLRSNSRMSMSSRQGDSRASDDDAKTSVRVAVRVRPPLQPSDPGFELIPQRFQRSMVHVTSPTSLSVDSPQGRKLFVFDKTFGEDVYQEGVWDYLSESVGAFVQGYNVSVMAYGQSGSGKSYTMGTSGPEEQNDSQMMGKDLVDLRSEYLMESHNDIQLGVIPRAAAALFEKLAGPPSLSHGGSGIRSPARYSTNSVHTLQSLSKVASDKSWQMKATYVEIYNEQLRDLLVPEHVPYSERSTVTIREDTKGRILLTGLQQVTINSIGDLLSALNLGSSIRQTDSTAINAKSSRSHAVFSINLVQRKNKSQQTPNHEKRMSMPIEAMIGNDSWVTVDSKLHFVDLAGSERLKNTGAFGERAREGISINAGLASLGKVISQLSSRQSGSHVSYRDSKLTRLLQDSLGGNAITYMIACVTPAEFHLSETLNTIQYAQRARAIQSKPRIQQISDDSDKQAQIDRLRAEISFLRDQIRNSEPSDRSGHPTQDRPDKPNEREMELHNHLLDIQENYTALSQRHAKLISEITKARDNESVETPTLNGAIGDSAVERLKRSNSFAQAADQVVLEYEKTIQSLETSLSNTRSSLLTTESSLLERETKCAYTETINQQLQTRIQKLIDRETSTERYLHDLEAKLDGRASGEEKSSQAMMDLRKEIARLRENAGNNEEYISTLEERLAEGDQDMELMQRELTRLEHVVERQRSLGKLDNLLYELDHVQSNRQSSERSHQVNEVSDGRTALTRKRGVSEATLKVAIETEIPESDDEDEGEHPPSMSPNVERQQSHVEKQSPAQSKYVAEKLDTVNQELFDLRVEHESTVNEYDLLSAKYEEALRTLAALQDGVDESRRPSAVLSGATSFLEDARVKELKNAGQSSSSRSLSSELSWLGESPATPKRSDFESPSREEPADMKHDFQNERKLSVELDQLKALNSEREQGMTELSEKYTQLQEEHLDTLDVVEELKAEVQKARLAAPPSPTSPVIRRKASQNLMTIDRAHRSLASLGNIASENFENDPDTMQNFELNLGAVMHELHSRSERVEALETELASVKKEMEMKMTIISGLTRERTSLKSTSPLDMSMISVMRDQLLHSENQIKLLHESSAAREKTLTEEIESLKVAVTTYERQPHSYMPGVFPLTPAALPDSFRELSYQGNGNDQNKQIKELQEEMSHWQGRHQAVVNSMETSEKQFLETISELEASLSNVITMHEVKSAEFDARSNSMRAATAAFEQERDMYADTINGLNKDISNHKATIDAHVSQIAVLEQSQIAAGRELEEADKFRTATQRHLEIHRDQISSLEQQLIEHQSAVEFHKHGLKSLHDSHSRDLAQARSSMLQQAEADVQARITDLTSKHTDELKALQTETDDLSRQVQEHRVILDEHMRTAEEQNAIIEKLKHEKGGNGTSEREAFNDLGEVKTRIAAAEKAKAEADVSLAKSLAKNEELNAELADLSEKYQRERRVVEQLEGQLSSTYEDSRATSGRLSLMQNSQNQELVEARAANLKAQEEIDFLSKRLNQLETRRGSPTPYTDLLPHTDRTSSLTNAALRKSAAVSALPSPPPAIPLPPLPSGALPNIAEATSARHPSPTASNHGLKDSISIQQADDQEARIRTIEKHLFAEKQLTATLEEALVDLETQGNKVKQDVEAWRKKAWAYEDELGTLRRERKEQRYSLQAVEEEREKRKRAEAAKATLEERMAVMGQAKKKKSGFNCF
ncbi:hypothetical protein MMC13_001113 [Lambiella insularis]|nr:hypothetical protein [Lambiella insularis]